MDNFVSVNENHGNDSDCNAGKMYNVFVHAAWNSICIVRRDNYEISGGGTADTFRCEVTECNTFLNTTKARFTEAMGAIVVDRHRSKQFLLLFWHYKSSVLAMAFVMFSGLAWTSMKCEETKASRPLVERHTRHSHLEQPTKQDVGDCGVQLYLSTACTFSAALLSEIVLMPATLCVRL